VILFDLFGRGLSSTPSPTKYPHNTKLFTAQIHMVLTSSTLSWTGCSHQFTIIGYSLGGAIAADFTSYFPSLIDHLVLIAPGGLIRKSHISWTSRALYARILPERLIQWLVAGRLRTGPQKKRGREPDADADADMEVKGGRSSNPVYLSSSLPLLPDRPRSTVSEVVDWQIDHHPGFIPSFISSIRYAPIHGQQARWEIIGYRLSRQRIMRRDTIQAGEAKRKEAERSGLERGKVLMILGERDPIIVAEEVEEDAKEVFGEDGVDIRVVKGTGHEVPIERADEVASLIEQFWGREDVEDLDESYGDVQLHHHDQASSPSGRRTESRSTIFPTPCSSVMDQEVR
jgi:pimeloyl-ACP methyl ester carboxylesterase